MLPLKVEDERSRAADSTTTNPCVATAPYQINEWVSVRMPKNKGVKPLMDVPVTIFGTLKVSEFWKTATSLVSTKWTANASTVRSICVGLIYGSISHSRISSTATGSPPKGVPQTAAWPSSGLAVSVHSSIHAAGSCWDSSQAFPCTAHCKPGRARTCNRRWVHWPSAVETALIALLRCLGSAPVVGVPDSPATDTRQTTESDEGGLVLFSGGTTETGAYPEALRHGRAKQHAMLRLGVAGSSRCRPPSAATTVALPFTG